MTLAPTYSSSGVRDPRRRAPVACAGPSTARTQGAWRSSAARATEDAAGRRPAAANGVRRRGERTPHNLPDAVFALHGLVDIEVATRIDSTHGRLRAIVGDVPDAPVSRAVVRMQGGQKGLFVNSRSLCRKAKRNRARVNAKGQNGRPSLRKPPMRALGCGKAHRGRHGGHRRGGARQ